MIDIYLKNKEVLRVELINYIQLYSNKDYIEMLNAIHKVIEDNIFVEKEKSFEVFNINEYK
jgi:hypothetical protein